MEASANRAQPLRADVATAQRALRRPVKAPVRRALDKLELFLCPDESVITITIMNTSTAGLAVCALTERRLLFSWATIGKRSQNEIALGLVTAIFFLPSTRRAASRRGSLVLGTTFGSLAFDGIWSRDAERMGRAVRDRVSGAVSPACAGASQPSPNCRLGGMNAGILACGATGALSDRLGPPLVCGCDHHAAD